MTDLERKIESFNRRGWYPAKYSHHPKLIRDAIRLIGYRPQIKACFMNCQRFVLGVRRGGFDPALLRVRYHEGFAVALIVITHAWLEFDGEVIDLTLDPDRATRYLFSKQHDERAILRTLARNKYWGPVDEEWLARNQQRAWLGATKGAEDDH